MELEIQDDDVNKENEIDGERKIYKTSFKNTKLPVTNEDSETKKCYQIMLSMDLILFAESNLNMLQDFKAPYLIKHPNIQE